ncbi:serine hydroxymethyltransferase [Candidatus Woesearchaeota archaeon]|nr:serine hydroxymethyltransferase [Candidatus Woesearchaeota archaeon]
MTFAKDFSTSITSADPIVAALIAAEKKRQHDGLEMIPSESFPSKAVLEALGSVFNNKYSEGYPKKRYYGGNEFVDEVEQLAIDRAKQLFGAEHANVQPYSGSPANAAIYFALLERGDKVMGMSLSQGGHLTHGHSVNFSGKYYSFSQYGVDKETEQIDMDAVRKMAVAEQPKMIISGYTAYPRSIDFKGFAEIATEVGAYSMVDMSHIAGLIAGDSHPSPFPFTDVVMSTTHKTLCGPRGAMILSKKDDPLREKYHPESKLGIAQRIDKAVFPGLQGGPHNHAIAAKAVAFGEALQPSFKIFAKQIVKNAQALAVSLQAEGLRLVSGGTDNHLLLVDLTKLGVTGQQAETALDAACITVNKNTVPYDVRGPFDPSGIRLGTPALTCRGMKEQEMQDIGKWIGTVVKNWNDPAAIEKVRSSVMDLTKQYQMYE